MPGYVFTPAMNQRCSKASYFPYIGKEPSRRKIFVCMAATATPSKHKTLILYNIRTKLDQRRRRWADVVQMLYKCFVFAGRRVNFSLVWRNSDWQMTVLHNMQRILNLSTSPFHSSSPKMKIYDVSMCFAEHATHRNRKTVTYRHTLPSSSQPGKVGGFLTQLLCNALYQNILKIFKTSIEDIFSASCLNV